MSDLCCPSCINLCRGCVCVSDPWRRSCIGVCRRNVSVSDPCRRGIGVCRVSDRWRRSILTFAEDASV